MKDRIKALFAEQVFYSSEDLWNLLVDIPRLAAVDLLNDIVNNKAFQVTHNDMHGYIRYCNGYYIFQPNVYADLTIPLAIRVSKFPVKRDSYGPLEYEVEEKTEIVEKSESSESSDSVETLWTAIVRWIEHLSHHNEYIVPAEIDRRRIDKSHQDRELLERYSNIIEMVEWFHVSYMKMPHKHTHAFRNALLFYFWDEWLTFDEQRTLISSKLDVTEFIRENQYRSSENEGIVIDRFLDAKDGSIIFLCNGEACPRSLIDMVTKSKNDPLKAIKVNHSTSGHPYGFITPKNGDIVFKTAMPPEAGMKVLRGKECANVSTMTDHIRDLIILGDILNENHMTNFDLHNGVYRMRVIKNATRACTLMNFILRFCDELHLKGRRWFYRPVASHYIGHKGHFRASKK
jgi:hypothetical protein